MNTFLASSPVIDWRDDEVLRVAVRLRAQSTDPIDFVRRAFEWVRDEIRHTGDYELDEVTCSASEVLRAGTGYCYAKSHLLVAIYRSQGIPAGLGYQRLSLNGEGAPYCLHGFAVVEIEGHGWRRLDPRGNRADLKTEFSIIQDSLAFQTLTTVGERTFSEILAEPLACVVESLQRYRTRSAFCEHLPDLEEIRSGA